MQAGGSLALPPQPTWAGCVGDWGGWGGEGGSAARNQAWRQIYKLGREIPQECAADIPDYSISRDWVEEGMARDVSTTTVSLSHSIAHEHQDDGEVGDHGQEMRR